MSEADRDKPPVRDLPAGTDRGDLAIVWRLHLRSAREDVFAMLATDEGRARFWAESAKESDGAVQFEFINGMRTTGRILVREPPGRIVFEYFGSVAAFSLEDDGDGGTDLVLTNTGVHRDDYDDVLPGWLNVLLPLKAAVDFGVDLRNHDPRRTWDRRFVDQ